jgi:excisionase family DNA binding protein
MHAKAPTPVEHRLLLTVEEAAERLGIGRSHAWRLVNDGTLPSVRLGRCVRVPLGRLEAWIGSRCEERDGASR